MAGTTAEQNTHSSILTTAEAARELGMSAEGVRHLHKTGQLPALRISHGWRLYQRCDVEALKAVRAQKAAAR